MDKAQIQSKCLEFIHSVESVDTNTSDTGTSAKQDRIEWNRGFYNGAHWTREEYNSYASQGIEPVKVNRCRPIVKAMKGMFDQNAQQISVEPRKNGNQSVSDVLGELVKHTEDESTPSAEGSNFVYVDCFQKGLIDEEAFLKAEVDKYRNPNGQLTFRALSGYDVDVDPLAKEYNLNETGRFVIERKWVDKGIIDIQFKDVLSKLKNNSMEGVEDPNGLYSYFTDDYSATFDEALKKFRYPIREIWWKEHIEGAVIVDTKTGKLKKTTDPKQIAKMKAQAKKQVRYTFASIVLDKLHKSTLLNNLLLDDEVNPNGDELTGIPYFRFCPYWHEGHKAGVLNDIIDLNREENVSRTQILRNLKQTLNTGWKVGGGTKKKKQELADFGSIDGLVIDESDYNGKVEKIKGNELPMGHFANAEQMEQDIKVVSGIDDAFLGYETGAKESGRAIFLKQQQSRIVSDDVFKNFNRTLTLFGNYVVRVILGLDLYTREEIYSIVSESTLVDSKLMDEAYRELISQTGASLPQPSMPQPPDPMMLQAVRPEDQQRVFESVRAGTQAAQMYSEQYPTLINRMEEVVKHYAILKMMDALEAEDLGEYGIRVTTSPSAPTTQMSNLLELMAIQDKYGIIPYDEIIQNSSLPNKDALLDKIERAMQQQQAQMQQPQPAGAA